MIEPTKEELISLCERAVVPCEEWQDRDSAIAQSNVYDIYERLVCDIPYTLRVEESTIWIDFEKPDEEGLKRLHSPHMVLNIESVEDYREKVDPEYEDEMFEPYPISYEEQDSGYLPTEKRLSEGNSEDWY